MYRDLFGNLRMKINFHQHTTLSDGKKTPEEAAAHYKAAGYDAVAFTDHWRFGAGGEMDGLRIFSGAEYNLETNNAITGCHHIIGICMDSAPEIAKDADVQTTIDEIHAHNGLAILGHPAWSLNRVHEIAQYHGFDATEIWNSVSDAHASSRPYSGHFVDAAMCEGMVFPLLATDDTHYYDGTDDGLGFIMLEVPENATDREIMDAVRAQKFYASQGPEVHLFQEGNEMVVRCSPVSRINFCSNSVYVVGHSVRGEGLTEARVPIKDYETFMRAEVVDEKGRMAWTNFIEIKQ